MQSLDERETFHPVIGAETEARALYLQQFALAERCRRQTDLPLVIWDVGLGAAGNAMHLIRCWQQRPGRDLHLLSFDLHDRALRFALAQRAADPQLFPWLADWDWESTLQQQGARLQAGKHTLHWHWRLADFPDLVARQGKTLQRPELICYDAYSPAKCWRMWQLQHWQKLRSLCGENCEIAFHSRSTALRVTLLLAGFHVGYGVKIGEKEQTTIAAGSLHLLRQPLDAAWLQRVKRSSAAQPFRSENYRPASISTSDYQRLAQLPQFQQLKTDAGDT